MGSVSSRTRFYETEAAEIVQAVYTEDDAERLGEAIQTVLKYRLIRRCLCRNANGWLNGSL